MRLYDALRCPYCARVRMTLAEKGLEHEAVAIDLQDRPEWIYDLNPAGRVPVLDDGGFVLPESAVIMGYLEETHPDPPLLPADARARARSQLLVYRFDDNLGDDYYAFRRGEPNQLEEKLAVLELGQSLFADVAYAPWVIRARELLGVALPARLQEWLERLEQRPSVAAEIAVVRSL